MESEKETKTKTVRKTAKKPKMSERKERTLRALGFIK